LCTQTYNGNKNYNNYTVQFVINNAFEYGDIISIFKIKNLTFCLVKHYSQITDNQFIIRYTDRELTNAMRDNFFKFFIILDTNRFEFVIVELDKIITKCIILEDNEKGRAWITPCFTLDEHD
jgi:hypothetical protein